MYNPFVTEAIDASDKTACLYCHCSFVNHRYKQACRGRFWVELLETTVQLWHDRPELVPCTTEVRLSLEELNARVKCWSRPRAWDNLGAQQTAYHSESAKPVVYKSTVTADNMGESFLLFVCLYDHRSCVLM